MNIIQRLLHKQIKSCPSYFLQYVYFVLDYKNETVTPIVFNPGLKSFVDLSTITEYTCSDKLPKSKNADYTPAFSYKLDNFTRINDVSILLALMSKEAENFSELYSKEIIDCSKAYYSYRVTSNILKKQAKYSEYDFKPVSLANIKNIANQIKNSAYFYSRCLKYQSGVELS